MKKFNRHPTDALFIVEYSQLNKYERKYLHDRNHHAHANECANVLYVFGRPFAILSMTEDSPYICEVCHALADKVSKCSTVSGTYWGHEKCIVTRAKKLFDNKCQSDATYFGQLFDSSQPMATHEDAYSPSKPRDFLFVAHLHGASMHKNLDCVELTFRDNSIYQQLIADQTYWTRRSKVYGE